MDDFPSAATSDGLLASETPGDNAPALTVSELSGALKRTVEDAFGHVRVRGEISGWKRHGSGHCYFTLKDADACIDAVLWRGQAGRLQFAPEDGAEVPASFTVELSTDEELSMSDSEALHVHLVYDGNEQEPDMIDTESFDVTGLEPGEHTITASLRDSAHAPTGPKDAITVMVEGGAGDKEDKKESGSDKY